MQIVIDISDKTYAEKDNPSFSVRAILEILQAVRNGTPLPKGHGRLIDADNLEKKAIETDDMYMLREIDDAPTII